MCDSDYQNNLIAEKHDIDNVFEKHEKEINNNICNQWMFMALIQMLSKDGLDKEIFYKFTRMEFCDDIIKFLVAIIRNLN